MNKVSRTWTSQVDRSFSRGDVSFGLRWAGSLKLFLSNSSTLLCLLSTDYVYMKGAFAVYASRE